MVKLSIWSLLKDQYRTLPDVNSFHADLTGKVAIVTGANVGLGLEAARHLARFNPGKLILACRSLKKGQEAVESIVKDTSCPNVECWELDLASFDSVKAFADRFEKEGKKLDLLIENAGINTFKFTPTKDGWETTLQVNHMSTVLLALRLLPFLLSAPTSPPTPRLVIVASEVHHFAPTKGAFGPNILGRLNTPDTKGKFEKMSSRYEVSKLFNIFFVRALAVHLRNPGPLTVNAVNPGFCHSSLTREVDKNPAVWLLKAILARSTEVGSRTLVHAGVSMDLQGQTGQYLNACRVDEANDFVLSDTGHKTEEQLWDETLALLVEVDPKVKEIREKYLS